MLTKLLEGLEKIRPARIAYAHCDVPCGIYDPHTAWLAAKTVLKMAEKITELNVDNPDKTTRNNFIRMVMTKEEHAQKCKQELLILWTDYFKEDHLKMFPNLHETFWRAAKLCSKNKQNIDLQAAQDLVKAVEHIADMFKKAEDAKKK